MTDTEHIATTGEEFEEDRDYEALLGFAGGYPLVQSVSGLYEWRIGVVRPLRARPGLPFVPGRHLEEIEETSSEFDFESDSEDSFEAELEELEALQAARHPRMRREELRLDVDGRTPQMAVSGTIMQGLQARAHWIAKLRPTRSRHQWRGNIWYKDGNTGLIPYTRITVRATGAFFPSQRKATVTFSGGGAPTRTHLYRFKSRYFHPVEFEFDTVKGATPVTEIDTCAHPNRPAALPCEKLSVKTVYNRAGFQVNPGTPGAVPLSGAGADHRWSNSEMHDAMQLYWSRFADRPQWAMWVLFAALHESGTSLGGIMFDSIGPNHRQGTAIFSDSFISNPPANETHPDAWVARMRFWTACHEMGHGFNLAHSWQKTHPPAWGTPWIPTPNENEARSFMNYPYNVAGGQAAFFNDFEYRFSDSELLFMRHAPARFVQMGNADWFDNHGFEQADTLPVSAFKLEVRANRDKREFEFLEPVMLELKLTNVAEQPKLVDKDVLSSPERLTIVIKKQGRVARQWSPFARYLTRPEAVALPSGQSIYDSLFVGAGLNGWDISEPGFYQVQVCLQMENEDVISNPLAILVSPPQGYDEERVAQDFFSEDVGRVLAFDGSHYLATGNAVLEDVADRFSDRRVAIHAEVALAMPKTSDYNLLSIPAEVAEFASAQQAGGKFRVIKPDKDKARATLQSCLLEDGATAAETLGHIDYNFYVTRYSDWLDSEGESGQAAKCQEELHHILSDRHVAGHVLEQVADRRNRYVGKKKKKAEQVA